MKRNHPTSDELGFVLPDRIAKEILCPTHNHRHTTKIREGRISHEVFQKDKQKD